MDDLSSKFIGIDTSDLPDFYDFQKPLEMGLWVLLVAKDKLGIKRLTASDIANVIIEAMEVSTNFVSITSAFNRAEDKVHTYYEKPLTYYAIMKSGQYHLFGSTRGGSVNVHYFVPGQKYLSKRVLADNILSGLEGDLGIVDPYCSIRSLDVLSVSGAKNVKFLTRLQNLSKKNEQQFIRELKDFNSEGRSIEFRNYTAADIHDRYIISSDAVVILGHSIKDLGAKESFAVVLNKEGNRNIFDSLVEGFNRRWKKACLI